MDSGEPQMYGTGKGGSNVIVSLRGNRIRMARLWPILMIVLTVGLFSACQNEDKLADDSGAGNKTDAGVLLPPTLVGEETTIIQKMASSAKARSDSATARDLAATAMQKVLFDPGSVQFSNLKTGRNGTVCGKYNAKNRYGAYVGFRDFVVTKEGSPVTSDNNDGLASVSGGYFATVYLGACASAKERSNYRTAMEPTPDYSESTPSMDTPPTPPQDQEPDAILDAPPRSKPVADETT